MENKFKRFLSMMLSVIMVLGMLPMNAFATEGVPAEIVANDENTGSETEVMQVEVNDVAKIGEKTYASLTEALAAANAGGTITFVADITEDVTVTKAVTFDGAGKTYTGAMTLKADTTIKNVNFDGKGYNGYAITTRGADYLTIEDCTAKNYGYGFVQLASATALTTVKNVTASNMDYGVKVDYSNAVVLENVDIDAKVAAVLNSNYGGKTITIKGSKLNILGTWTRNNTTKTNYVFEGANTIDRFITDESIDNFKLAEGATLKTKANITVVDKDGNKIDNVDGTYNGEEKVYVAEYMGTQYESLSEAIAAALASDEDEVTVTILEDTDEAINVPNLNGKKLTLKGAEQVATFAMRSAPEKVTVSGGMSFGTDTNKLDEGEVIVENLAFTDKGVAVKEIEYVTVQNCTFNNIEGDAIEVVGDTLTEEIAITDNIISNVKGGAGINVRTPKKLTIEGNVVQYTTGNSITVQHGKYADNVTDITITDNKLTEWAEGQTEGRAIRVAYNMGEVSITENVMSSKNVPEQFVKVTGADAATSVSLENNYWGGKNPVEAANTYEAEGVEIKKYYADALKKELLDTVVAKDVAIGSVEDLLAFSAAVTGNTEYQGIKVAANPEAVIILTADLDLADSGFAPIGNGAANAFSGTFDGQGHTISNMTLSCDYYRGVGFFRNLGKGAVIKNVTFVNANIDNGAATGANHFYGVVAGFSNNLTLDNVDIKDSAVACKYSGAATVGCIEGATIVKNCDIENFTLATTSIRGSVFGVLGNSANGHTISDENNTVKNAVFVVDGEIKTIEDVLNYNEWADGTDYTNSTYVAQIGDKKYSTLYDAVTAAAADDIITLIGDVKRTEALVVTKNVTIDLGGHTITGTDGVYPIIRVQNDADVTIKNGTVKNDNYVFVLGAADGSSAGNLTIEDGTYIGETIVASVTKGQLTIKGGEFSITDKETYDYAYLLNCIDANYKDGSAKIVVTGGTFHKFNPENNAAEGAGTNFVAEGYMAEADGDNYKVVEKKAEPAWAIGKTQYMTLQDAVDAAAEGATITLLRDAEGAGAVIDKSITVKFNGYTYTLTEGVGSKGTESNGFQILKGNKVTLYGDKGLKSTLKVADSAADKFYILVQNYADLTITALNLDGTNLDKWSKTDGDSYTLSNNSGRVLINGKSVITANNDGDKAFAFDVCDQTAKGYTAPVVTVSNSTIKGEIEAPFNVGSNYYATLQSAVDEYGGKGAINLRQNASGAGAVIDKDVTIYFNGYTYTLTSPVGSKGTESNGLQILKGNKVMLKGGTLNVAESAADKFYILIQNYADLNMISMTLDGTNLDKWSKTDGDSYTLSNNSGNVTVNATKIIANNEGDLAFAFDACDKSEWGYELPVVNVLRTAVIEGNIEAAAMTTNGKDEVYYATLQQAIDAATDKQTVTLMSDIKLEETDVKAYGKLTAMLAVEGKNITLDMNGKTIDAEYDKNELLYAVVYVGDGASLTVKGEGKINLTTGDTKAGKYDCVAYMFLKDGANGTLNIENGTFTANKVEDSMVYTNGDHVVKVKGGNWTLENVDTKTNGSPWIFNAKDNNKRSIDVSGGTYNFNVANQHWVFEVDIVDAKGNLGVIVDNGNGTWTVTGETAEAAIVKKVGEYDHKIGYATLEEAVAAAQDGETIRTFRNAEIEKTTIDKNIVIDTNGYNVTGEFVLGNANATLTAPEGLTVTTTVKNSVAKYVDGVYKVVAAVAKTGDGKFFATLEEAVAHANAKLKETTITLLKDVEVSETLVINTAAIRSLGTNGKTIKSTADVAIRVANGTKSFYIQGTLDTSAAPAGSVAIQIETASSVKINTNAIINAGENTALKLIKAVKEVSIVDAKVNAGQFIVSDTKGTVNVYLEGAAVTINGNDSYTAAVEIYGGKLLVGMKKDQSKDKSTIKVAGEHVVYVAADCLANYNGVIDFEKQTGFLNKYQYMTVTKGAEYQMYLTDVAKNVTTGKVYGSLQAAIEAAQNGETIKVMKNIDLANCTPVLLDNAYNTYFKVEGKSITIDLNGKTISGDYADTETMMVGLFSTENNGHLTLTGNGTVNVTASGNKVYSLIANYEPGCSIIVENGTYKLDKALDSLIYSGVTANEGDLTLSGGIAVKGGTFTLDNVGQGPKGNGSPWIFNVLNSNNGHIWIEGGSFNADVFRQHWFFETNAPKELALKHENDMYTVVPAVAYVNEQGWSSQWYTKNIGYATLEEAFANAEGVKTKVVGKKTYESAEEVVTLLNVETNVTVDSDTLKAAAAVTNGKDVYLANPKIEMTEAIEIAPNRELLMNSSSTIEFNGNGNTITANGTGTAPNANDYGYVGFIPANGCDATVKNVTVTGSGFVEVGHHGTSTKGNYTINNLTVKDLVATLAVNNGGNNIVAAFGHYGYAEMTDCVMTGTTTLKEGFKPYDAAFVNGTTTIIDKCTFGKIYLAHQAKVTITNTMIDVIDSYAISTNKLGKLVIGAGAEIGVINLHDTGSYKATLTIEEGANVGAIVYNGATYTMAQWMER